MIERTMKLSSHATSSSRSRGPEPVNISSSAARICAGSDSSTPRSRSQCSGRRKAGADGDPREQLDAYFTLLRTGWDAQEKALSPMPDG
jgi:hypothetical protein